MTLYSVSTISVHVSHAHEWAFTHVYTHTHRAARGWPEEQWTSSPALLHVFTLLLHSLPSRPLLLLSSQRQRQQKAQRLPLLQAFSFADCLWDTWPDLSTCADVDESRHCLDFFFFSVLHFLLHVFLKKQLKDYFLCPSFSWFPLCVKRCWRCNFNYSSFL